jgi:hypothetical protein
MVYIMASINFEEPVKRDPELDSIILLLNEVPPYNDDMRVSDIYGHGINEFRTANGDKIKYPQSMEKLRDAYQMRYDQNYGDMKVGTLRKMILAYQSGGKPNGVIDLSTVNLDDISAQAMYLQQHAGVKDVGSLFAKGQSSMKKIVTTIEDKKTQQMTSAVWNIVKLGFGAGVNPYSDEMKKYVLFLRNASPDGYKNYLDTLRKYWLFRRRMKDGEVLSDDENSQYELLEMSLNTKKYSTNELEVSASNIFKGVIGMEGGDVNVAPLPAIGTTVVMSDPFNKSMYSNHIRDDKVLPTRDVLGDLTTFTAYTEKKIVSKEGGWDIFSFKTLALIVVIVTMASIGLGLFWIVGGTAIAFILLSAYYIKPEFSYLKRAYVLLLAFCGNVWVILYYLFYY